MRGRTRASGELEQELLRILRASDHPLTGKEIQAAVPEPLPAYTTILTALDRLRTKGDVVRVGEEARGIRFAATRSDAEHAGQVMLDGLAGSRDRQAALLAFAGNLDDEDLSTLRRAVRKRSRKGDEPDGSA